MGPRSQSTSSFFRHMTYLSIDGLTPGKTRREALAKIGSACLACICGGRLAYGDTDTLPIGEGCLPRRTGVAVCESNPKTVRIGVEKVAPIPAIRHQLELGISSILNAVGMVTNLKISASFYEDDVWPNAMASYRTNQGFDGEILIGWSLVSRVLDEPDGSFYLAAILAHESSHIVQLKHDMCAALLCDTLARIELHADFLAGAILRRAGVPIPQGAEKLIVSNWRKLGDTEYGNFNHHGTPEQRLACLTEGFRSAAMKSVSLVALASNAALSIDRLGVCGQQSISSTSLVSGPR